jgi:5-methylcytosine-specific restriction enzyme A
MPNAAPRPCSYPGCGVLVHDGSGRCAKHVREVWVKRPTVAKRITGRRLQALRTALFRENPLCVLCQAEGRVTLATQRDHIKPLAEGGTDTEDNVEGLCEACHEAKSQAEAQRGRVGGGSKV